MKSEGFTPIRPRSGIIGHRGIASLAPENTLASFKLAAELGLDWIEFDVRLIKDGNLVIFHDDNLIRTTNGRGEIIEATFKDLALLDAGSWFHPRFANEQIPLLIDALPELINLELNLNIELKVPVTPTAAHIQTFAEIFNKVMRLHWPRKVPLPLVSSFNWDLLRLVQIEFPEMPMGYLSEKCTADTLAPLVALKNCALHSHHENFTDNIIDLLHQHELPFLAYTVNEAAEAKRLLDAGAFAIFSDNPPEIIKSLTQKS